MGHNIGGASYFGRVATVLVAKTHCYRVLWPGYQIAETIAGTILRIRTTGCMHTWQSSYEIVGDCSDKGGHRYQPLDRFILQEVLARRRKIFMLRVMSTLFLIKCFGIELCCAKSNCISQGLFWQRVCYLTLSLLLFFYEMCRCDHWVFEFECLFWQSFCCLTLSLLLFFYKMCRCDHWVFKFESFSILMWWWLLLLPLLEK